jgi:hypothetical protein
MADQVQRVVGVGGSKDRVALKFEELLEPLNGGDQIVDDQDFSYRPNGLSSRGDDRIREG